jgi:alpha-D-xyloside xylohydrolase
MSSSFTFFSKEENRLIWRYDGETLQIEAWGQNSLRVRASKNSGFSPQDWALLPPEPVHPLIAIEEEKASIKNGKIEARITKSGKIVFLNSRGEILLEEYVRNTRDVKSRTCSALMLDSREWKPAGGGDYKLTARFESPDPSEKIYGMGQYQQPFLNLKGVDLELAQRNSQASVPFALSSRGYGFLWNNPAVGRVCFGKNLTTWEAYSTTTMDYWITAGDSPAEIEEAYAKAAGTVPLMPEYGAGFWQCKLRYQTQDEILEVAREYQKRGLPLSVIVVDFFHWTSQGDWKFDPQYWPDPEGMVRELKSMGVELMISVWPTVDRQSENYQEMLEKGYLVRSEQGSRINMDFLGNVTFFDATNSGARKFVWDKIKKNYYQKGIQLFWLDVAEPEFMPCDFANYRYREGPVLQIGNVYPAMYAKTFFDGMKQEGQEKIVNLIRCAWAGSQRYGALVWSGDIHSSFESFRIQLAAGLNMGMAGIPWWTTDIGGFHGGNIHDPRFHELLVRWFQWGCFCPVMRLHGHRLPFKKPLGASGGGLCASGAENEVWSFGGEVYEICKKYLFLREKLRPYIMAQMDAAHKKGTPVMRPLFYDYPEDKAAWEIEDEYMFGPDYLAAPVMYEGWKEREVYLPAGAQWTCCWTREQIEGGQTITASAPPDRIPVFSPRGLKFSF